jgi:hypothetical protein
MNLKGGVIIIGSLLWDNKNRCGWRKRSLKGIETKIPLLIKIRYGRESCKKRNNTYTMVFSNHPTTRFGQGYIVRLKNNIENEDMLKEQAIALAKAEGIWTTERPFLGKDWGAVGLLVNGKKSSADLIKSIWLRLFQEYRCVNSQCHYDYTNYCIGDEQPIIDKDGFLHIDWSPEMNDFDFLIATATAPKPKRPMSAKEIAAKMIEMDYRVYFDNNRIYNITTYQDDEILKHLHAADS